MPNSGIFSKVAIPTGGQNYLRRNRLHSLLAEAILKPAVTVIAGTGFGKTQAVYSFLQDSDAVTTWVPLSPLDNISFRFWGKLVQVIAMHNERLALNMEIIGFPDTTAKFNMFASLLEGYGADENKYIAVFDDFQAITEKKILLLVENIINACIPNICVILISRTEPAISLTDLLVKDMVFGINEDDLRFSRDEMGIYFDMQGISMSPRAMTKIHDTTDGWIFAIRLIELAIKQGAPHEELAIDAMKLNLFKLMESKFFSDTSREVQEFLVKLSLFQSLPADFVRLLSGNNEELITEALKINSFVRYDSFTNTYCIHHLFLDFIRQKQDMLPREEKADCYRCAAGWYVANGYKIDAINYYGQAADYEQMLEVIFTLPHTLPEEVAVMILGILDEAQAEAFERVPLLCILRARAMMFAGQAPQGMVLLAELRKRYQALPLTPQTRSLLCEAYIIEAMSKHMSCVYTNDFTFLELFIKAYEYMPKGSDVMDGKYNNHELGSYVCRVSSEKKEDMEGYIAAVSACVPYVSQMIKGYTYGLDDLARAELAYFRSDIKAAESYAYHAMYKAKEKGQHDIQNRAQFYLLRAALSSGAYDKIKDLLAGMETRLEEKSADYRIWYDIAASWVYSSIGCGNKAAGWIKSNYVKNNMDLLVSGSGNLATIKYCLLEKRYDELLTFMDNEANTSAISSFLFGKIALLLNKSVCLYHAGMPEEALVLLQEAYALARPNDLIMLFVEMGNDMVSLVKLAIKSKDCAIPDDWLKNVLRKSSTYAKRLSAAASEYKSANLRTEAGARVSMTKKELDFLTGLCQGMSAAEIAENHGISKNYVNNRLQMLYSKLGAQNVKDAIHIATSMNLIG